MFREVVLSVVTVGVIEVGELGGDPWAEAEDEETFRNWLCVGGLTAVGLPSPGPTPGLDPRSSTPLDAL